MIRGGNRCCLCAAFMGPSRGTHACILGSSHPRNPFLFTKHGSVSSRSLSKFSRSYVTPSVSKRPFISSSKATCLF